eukprot:TRINITY_DN36863_c0_g1_i1.p1 TRINITY_DN36863_c0_g1~~TRINITY_DN36863_c0_g1_i1.p1  ORF type:complete len:196 (+),score=48.82 TRINITY_DN36863_c0_g1_i1:144-731(+)
MMRRCALRLWRGVREDVRRLEEAYDFQRYEVLRRAVGERGGGRDGKVKEAVRNMGVLEFEWTEEERARLANGADTKGDQLNVVARALYRHHFGPGPHDPPPTVIRSSHTNTCPHNIKWNTQFKIFTHHTDRHAPLILTARTPHHTVFWLWDYSSGMRLTSPTNRYIKLEVAGEDDIRKQLVIRNKLGDILGVFRD